jgi:hypothetical protein
MCLKDGCSGIFAILDARKATWALPRPLSIVPFPRLRDSAGPSYQIRDRSWGKQGIILAEYALILECRPLSWRHAGNRISISQNPQSLMSVPLFAVPLLPLWYLFPFACMCASSAGPVFAKFSSPCPCLLSVRAPPQLKDLLHIRTVDSSAARLGVLISRPYALLGICSSLSGRE